MRNLTLRIAFIMITSALFSMGCKKSETDAVISLPQTFKDTTTRNIPDATNVTGPYGSNTSPGILTATLNVPFSASIKDATKVTITLEFDHTWCGDLMVELFLPSGVSGGALIKRMGAIEDNGSGAQGDFKAGNKFSFNAANATFIDWLPATIVGGNFAPTAGVSTFPASVPLCNLSTYLNNASVKGDWKIKVYDYGKGDIGKLRSWSIIFTEGAF